MEDNKKNNFKSIIDKLRSSGLRPTRQRLLICKVLFGENKDFHFTAEDLDKIIKNNNEAKIFNICSSKKLFKLS